MVSSGFPHGSAVQHNVGELLALSYKPCLITWLFRVSPMLVWKGIKIDDSQIIFPFYLQELQDSGEENEDEERTEEQKSEEPSRNTFSNIVNNKG